MNNRDKSALALALAIVGGIAAGLRCDASVTVETPTQYTPRPAAYTVKAYTEGSDPFIPVGGIVYLQLLVLIVITMWDAGAMPLLVAGAVLLVLLRLFKRALPKVSAS